MSGRPVRVYITDAFVQQEIPCHTKKGFPDILESLMV